MRGRGTQQALTLLDRYLKDEEWTQYCLKTDVKKYFPSIPKDRLIAKLERKFKDPDLIWILKEIIYGFPGDGLPIGNYTSQYLANFYFHDIYHDLKHNFHCKYILGYMDDWIILGKTKSWLRRVKKRMEMLLEKNGLTLKSNWQIFPVSNGIPFLGYITFPDHRLLRRRSRYNLRRACHTISKAIKNDTDNLSVSMLSTLASYHGILKWCNGWTLEGKTICSILPRGYWDADKNGDIGQKTRRTAGGPHPHPVQIRRREDILQG